MLIRNFRSEAKWSQERLAEKLQVAGWDIDQSTVARIESGKRTLLDYELQFFLDAFEKDWADVVRDGVKPRICPEPQGVRRNLYGEMIRACRIRRGWSQETLAAKIQLAGWDIDRVLVTLIELGRRPLLDYELKYFLNVFGKDWKGIFGK